MALSNIELIMIRASFVDSQYAVRLSQVSLDHGEQYPSYPNRQAAAVEVCQCPEGYTGSSCEKCAPGYRRSPGGFYLGLCERSSNGILFFGLILMFKLKKN